MYDLLIIYNRYFEIVMSYVNQEHTLSHVKSVVI
jgi:hypothetical protein